VAVLGVVVEAPAVDDPRWVPALHDVVADPSRLSLHAQPIAELTSGAIAGYELLSRFEGPWTAPPDRWFAAADRWGLNAVLQARVLRAAIAARSSLPPNTFLTVNVDPHLLADSSVAGVLTAARDLTRLVLELTEHTRPAQHDALRDVLAHVRTAGGMVAMDDAGTGYAGLTRLLDLRPNILKLDRELVTGIDSDPVKSALVEVLGDLTGRMDTWLLAEGIETGAELDTLVRLGVPLGQGWALARPAATMAEALPSGLVEHIRRTAARCSLDDYVASVARPATIGIDRANCTVLLNQHGQAAEVKTEVGTWRRATLVSPSTRIADAARRAMTRTVEHRYAPLVCTDGQGQVIGVVTVDDLVLALSNGSTPAPPGRQDT
jgi:EAL domain-containing protein (putative c-di-GMP-specific phosphodiesterase class I)